MTAELTLELSLTTNENKDGFSLELPCVLHSYHGTGQASGHPAVPSHRDMDQDWNHHPMKITTSTAFYSLFLLPGRFFPQILPY